MTAFLLGLPGATYLYQGQELGLPNAPIPESARTDPASPGGVPLGRDAARVPLPWSGEWPGLGFTEAASTWLPQPPDWAEVSVAAQSIDPSSALSTVRRAIAARRRHVTTDPAATVRFEQRDGVVLARTDTLTVIVNMSGEDWPCDTDRVVFTTAPRSGGTLPPDHTAWIDHRGRSHGDPGRPDGDCGHEVKESR